MRALGFFLVLLAICAACNGFVALRASEAFALGARGRRWLRVLLVAAPTSLVVGRSLAGSVPEAIARALAVAGATVQLGAIIAAVFLLPPTFASFGARLIARLRGKRPPPPEPNEPPVLTRRSLLARSAAGTALAAGASSSLYGTLFGRHDYVTEELVVPLAKLRPALDGFTLVQLSDIHFGLHVGESELRAAVELVRAARPDQIVLTGDLLDHDPRYAPRLGELCARLREIAPVAAVPGNHDYYAGIGTVLTTLRRAGAEVLVNRTLRIGEGAIALCGVDDVWAERNGGRGPELERALASLPDDLPRVLLCHNPVFFPDAAPHVDVQLSGHTHGGQVALGFNPVELFLPYGYVAGSYRRGGATLWVNRGFGTAGPPSRIGAAPEVTRIVLARG